jgi:cell pole-organizing protein PopZ
MADVRNEPSMEEILASIKRIIAEDGATPQAAPRGRRGQAAANGQLKSEPLEAASQPVEPEVDEEVLELTDTIDAPGGAEPAPPQEAEVEQQTSKPATSERPAPPARLVSETAASASRSALEALSALIVKPEAGADNTLDGLVREMLRPMLKEWLDARLPELVEKLVEKEIARITGRSF